MNTKPHNSEAQVLKRLLAETRPFSGGESPHLDDETLAQFAAGALNGAERDAAVRHLAGCDHCREVASLLMEEAEEPALALAARRTAWFSPQVLGYVLAASLLVGVSGYLVLPAMFRGGPGGGQVAKNDPPVPGTKGDPTKPPLRPPLETIAFASQGRLTDYGFGLDGRRSVEYTTIKSLEALPSGQDIESLLKRGHLLLSLGEAKLAAEVFEQATAKFPHESVGWLGAGLAAFVDRNHEAAGKHFRKALELDPQSQSARVNLAITLEAKNDRAGALQVWKALLRERLTPADHAKFEAHLKALEAEPKPQ